MQNSCEMLNVKRMAVNTTAQKQFLHKHRKQKQKQKTYPQQHYTSGNSKRIVIIYTENITNTIASWQALLFCFLLLAALN